MTKTISKKASVENYIKLAKRGFTNKQIAIYWRTGLMNIAAFAANATRQGFIRVK